MSGVSIHLSRPIWIISVLSSSILILEIALTSTKASYRWMGMVTPSIGPVIASTCSLRPVIVVKALSLGRISTTRFGIHVVEALVGVAIVTKLLRL
jgi:hypothetical protein